MKLGARTVFLTDEPLEANLGSTDVELVKALLTATALQNLREFSGNPKVLEGLLNHGLLQWDLGARLLAGRTHTLERKEQMIWENLAPPLTEPYNPKDIQWRAGP